ncbi:MAG: hypothetical protein AB2L26_03045 [Ignavibacteria bacterium]
MPKYVMVSADFPDATEKQRIEIYKRLMNNDWHKIVSVGRDISTTWWAEFDDNVSDADALSTSIIEFREYSQPYTIPLLVLHVGPKMPIIS